MRSALTFAQVSPPTDLRASSKRTLGLVADLSLDWAALCGCGEARPTDRTAAPQIEVTLGIDLVQFTSAPTQLF